MEKFLDERDCAVERDSEWYPGQVVLLDEMGDLIFSGQASTWTDDQIKTVLHIINKYYGLGHAAGRDSMRKDFKSLMGN